MNALLHIDARDLTFEETVNGWRKVIFEIAAFTFGDNGRVMDQSDRTYTVRNVGQGLIRSTLESGIFYSVNLPIKKAGAYQLRDGRPRSTSKRIGSANQFIEVPDVKKGRLTLSGIDGDGQRSCHGEQCLTVSVWLNKRRASKKAREASRPASEPSDAKSSSEGE